MGFKRNLLEGALQCAARLRPAQAEIPERVDSIFVLRNNNFGDLLAVTPLFEALKRLYPAARIEAGIGNWNKDFLRGNPSVDRIVPINAPWHNHFVRKQGLFSALHYIFRSPEVRALASEPPAIGIDVLGSGYGSLLFLRAGIQYRLGVCGYAGGHSAAQQTIQYDAEEHVGRAALRLAELLGASSLPPLRPQIFLTSEEEGAAERRWQAVSHGTQGLPRIVVGPGGGFTAKCWPLDHFVQLSSLMARSGKPAVAVVGASGDRAAGRRIAGAGEAAVNLAGDLGLRETSALVSRADLVISNSSMLMHVAAAFALPNLVLLGDWYASSSQHARQWGYETTKVLGKEAGRTKIYSPLEAFEQVRASLQSAGEKR